MRFLRKPSKLLTQILRFAMYSLQLQKEILVMLLLILNEFRGVNMEQKVRHSAILGNNIRRLRHNAELSQEQVVAKMELMGCKITRSIYSQIEAGTYNIRVEELRALKQIFNVSYDEFFENESGS